MSDALASPTLALLYLAQGHDDRARSTLAEVLADDPTNGHALALVERLHEPARPRVELAFVASSEAGGDMGAGELELDWDLPGELLDQLGLSRDAFHVVLAIAEPRAGRGLVYRSLPCAEDRAPRREAAPLGPASGVAALVTTATPGGHLRVLAVADPVSW